MHNAAAQVMNESPAKLLDCAPSKSAAWLVSRSHVWTTSLDLFENDMPNVALGLSNASVDGPARSEWSFSLSRPIASANVPESFKPSNGIGPAEDSMRAAADTEAEGEYWDDWSMLASDQHFWCALPPACTLAASVCARQHGSNVVRAVSDAACPG